MLALSKAEAQARKDTVAAQSTANELRKENEALREQLSKVCYICVDSFLLRALTETSTEIY